MLDKLSQKDCQSFNCTCAHNGNLQVDLSGVAINPGRPVALLVKLLIECEMILMYVK